MIKPLFFSFLVLCFAIAHTLFLRLKLPAYGSRIGTYLDDISYAMIIAFILLFIFNLPSLLRKICLFLFVLIIQFLVFGEWWHYEFYRDYIRYASLGHTTDLQEIARGIEGFQSRYLALFGSVGFFLAALILETKSNFLRGTTAIRTIIIGAVLLLALIPTGAYTHYYKLSQIENWYLTTAIPLNYKNPVLQLLRERFIDRIEIANITPLHSSKVNQLYDNGNTLYPFYKQGAHAKKQNLKNIIFMTLESVRKYETIARNDVDLTPNFNRISVKNFTPKFYYANSNQTIKAEIALLCGVHDFLIGTSISAGNNQPVKINCLPQLLKEYGYRSYWFHGAKSDLFNRDIFLPKIGFDELHDRQMIERKYIREGEQYSLRHWGVEDPDTFDYALDYLEKSKQPFLAEILSVSNHHPFVDIETTFRQEDFHPDIPFNSGDIYNRYQHLTYYTDKALGKFWRAFEQSPLYGNTIVVISGDHGIWLFPEEIEKNTKNRSVLKYETYLRLPLTIYFPDKSFSAEADVALSQVDVPEILMNYIGLEEPRAFQSKLKNNIINKLLNGEPVPNSFTNPVFSSIGDNFYYRNSNIACYPPIQSKNDCDDYLFRCIEDHNILQTDKNCVSLEEDILVDSQIQIEKATDYDLDAPNAVVDYFRKSIYFGTTPEAEVLSQNR